MSLSFVASDPLRRALVVLTETETDQARGRVEVQVSTFRFENVGSVKPIVSKADGAKVSLREDSKTRRGRAGATCAPPAPSPVSLPP